MVWWLLTVPYLYRYLVKGLGPPCVLWLLGLHG